jgi:hypothetical protein
MFEYHGWINVQPSTAAEDEDDDGRLHAVVADLQARIRDLGSPYLLDLRWMNGEAFLHLGGFPNHRDGAIPAFFREVGERAPGSYGLLHIRDDEAPGQENEVRVLRMVRGRVTEHTEDRLSPCIPVLEDPFPGQPSGARDPAAPPSPPPTADLP